MNEYLSNKPQPHQEKGPIKALSLIALITTVIGCIGKFLFYERIWSDQAHDDVWKASFYFPSFLTVVSVCLAIAACILLVIFAFTQQGRQKTSTLVPVTFLLLTIGYFLSLITSFNNFKEYYYYYDFYNYLVALFEISHLVLLIVGFILATVSTFKGTSYKVFIIIAIVLGLLSEFSTLIGFFSNMTYYTEVNIPFPLQLLLLNLASFVGKVTLFVALLIFGVRNKPSDTSVVDTSYKNIPGYVTEQTPEEMLETLKVRFELGLLTEEEYKEQRAEIIKLL